MSKRQQGKTIRRAPRPAVAPAAKPEDFSSVPMPEHLPGSWARLGPDGVQGFEMVRGLRSARQAARQAERDITARVIEARQAGVAWEAIGWAVGLTGEGCRLRWGPSVPGSASKPL